MKTLFNRHTLLAFAYVMMAGQPGSVYAAPGDIADTPLFLQSSVQPNIFFLIDDSGSMNWEVLLSNDARVAHAGNSESVSSLDYTPDNATEMRRLCHGYNVMAYNPKATYTPWSGVDEDGLAYTDKTLTTALNNPYDNDDTDSLTNHFYFTWNDDGDGIYESGECADNYDDIDTSDSSGISKTECEAAAGVAAGCVSVSSTSLSDDDRQNYANWYTYYRKREYVMKRALSEIITSSTERMGLATLHGNGDSGFAIADVDDITTPVNTAAQTSKNNLLKELFKIDSSSGTPLVARLNNVGNYFKGSGSYSNLFNGSSPSSPILSTALGGTCQQNFAVVMSDGFWNGTLPSVGNTDADGPGRFDGGAYADTASNTLADVAMKFYEEDLRTDLEGKVKAVNIANNASAKDDNEEQHLVTYTVAFGLNGTKTPYDSNDAATDNPEDPAFTWPTPTANTLTTIDDMWHAAYNSRGLYLSASDPQELIAKFGEAIADIDSKQGTAAAVSFNSTSVQSDTVVFQAFFDSDGWSGSLQALPIAADGTLSSFDWDAATNLDARGSDSNPGREIITYNGLQGIPFAWPAGYTGNGGGTYTGGVSNTGMLSQSQVRDLLANAVYPESTTTASELAENNTFGIIY